MYDHKLHRFAGYKTVHTVYSVRVPGPNHVPSDFDIQLRAPILATYIKKKTDNSVLQDACLFLPYRQTTLCHAVWLSYCWHLSLTTGYYKVRVACSIPYRSLILLQSMQRPASASFEILL